MGLTFVTFMNKLVPPLITGAVKLVGIIHSLSIIIKYSHRVVFIWCFSLFHLHFTVCIFGLIHSLPTAYL